MSDDYDDFEDIASKSCATIVEPHDLPDGNWRLQALRTTKIDLPADSRAKYKILTFYKPIEALGDVDKDLLKAVTQDDIDSAQIPGTFWIENAKDEWEMLQHFEHVLGGDAGGSVGELWASTVGSEVIGLLKTTPGKKDASKTYTNVDMYTAV